MRKNLRGVPLTVEEHRELGDLLKRSQGLMVRQLFCLPSSWPEAKKIHSAAKNIQQAIRVMEVQLVEDHPNGWEVDIYSGNNSISIP